MPTVRLGLVTLPLAGLLATWATIAGSTFLDFTDAGVDPGEAARAYSSLGYFLSQFLGYVVGLTLLTLGIFALTVYLAELRGERWVLGATILSILGTGLLLSHYGLRTYALPALGGAYLSGQENAVGMANTIFGNPGENVFYVPSCCTRRASFSLASPSGVPGHYPGGRGSSWPSTPRSSRGHFRSCSRFLERCCCSAAVGSVCRSAQASRPSGA